MEPKEASKHELINELSEISKGISGLEAAITERRQAEEALRESQERYRILTEEALVGVYIYSEPDRRYLFVNRAFQEITGYSRAELLTIDPNTMVVPEDRWILEERGKAHRRGEEVPLEYTIRIRRKNGEIAYVMSRVHHILYGNRKAYLGHSIDITERMRAEEIQKLQYHIATAVLTTENLHQLFRLIQKELGNVMDTSNFSIAFYDKASDTITPTYSMNERRNTGAIPARKTLTAYVIRNGKPLLVTQKKLEELIQSNEIEIDEKPAKVWLGAPLKVRGEVIGAVVIQNYGDEQALGEKELNILEFVSSQIGLSIERRKTEAALRHSLQRNEALLQAIPDVIFVLSRNGIFSDYKADRDAALVIPHKDIVGKNIRELGLSENYVSLMLDAIEKALTTTRMQALEFELQTRKGLNNYEAHIVPLSHDEVLTVVRDITQRKQVEEELKLSLVKLQKTIENTLQAMAEILERRDPYTAGHQKRVAVLALAIAREMHLPEEQMRRLHIASLIHDIGKIYIPAEILSRPTVLTESEFALIKTHAEAGYNILRTMEYTRPIAEIIRQHHERLDGSGYPQGLRDGQILLEAEILAVADVVEAMSSHRPYRPARGVQKTLDEISQNRGRLYDKEVADICLKLFTEKGFAFEIV